MMLEINCLFGTIDAFLLEIKENGFRVVNKVVNSNYLIFGK